MEFETFRKHVKDALEHLDDAAHLQTHPLLAYLRETTADGQLTRAQRLRAWLKNAIEQLKPAPDLPSHAPEWRGYLALRYRYVQRMNPLNIESELGISERQFYRELNKGLEALAALLWESAQANRCASSSETQVLENELSQWNLTRQPCSLHTLLADTLATLAPLIENHRIQVISEVDTDLPDIFVDATLTRQALLNTLRLAIQHARPRVKIRAQAEEKCLRVVIEVEPAKLLADGEDWHNAQLLFNAQGGTLEINAAGQVIIRLPRVMPTRVLVVDDNPAIQQLFERYLAPQQYEVIHARSGSEALRLAEEIQPHIITLDVMMPTMDGWQVLRALKQNPTTTHIPIVVCSVLNEPEIALSLGARAYLKKPIDRLTLVETLTQVLAGAAATR
ncbi:MAG: response regulator [Anaerolineae bacterium]|nr:response regulator [Anaerolineae bacterium]